MNSFRERGMPGFASQLIALNILCLLFGSASLLAQVDSSLQKAMQTAQASAVAPLLTRLALSKKKPLREVSLAPDGNSLVYIVEREYLDSVWYQDLESHKSHELFQSKRVLRLHWAKDGSVVFMQTAMGIAVVDIKRNAKPMLIMNVGQHKDDHFFRVDTSSPHHVFVSKVDAKGTHQLYRVSKTGDKQLLHESATRLRGFLLDDNKEVAIIRVAEKVDAVIYALNQNGKQEILRGDFYDSCSLESYNAASKSIRVISSRANGLASLLEINIETGQQQIISTDAHKTYDLSGVGYDQQSNQPLLALYNRHQLDNQAIHPDMQSHTKFLEQKFPNTGILISASLRSKNWLVEVAGERDQFLRYFVYQPKQQNLTQLFTDIAKQNPAINPQHFAQSTPISYTASDGMILHGYVMLPLGVQLNSAPVVVAVHGGPWAREDAGFNGSTQQLANRGYLVFTPNFRSSTGYGRKYMESANRDFGDGRVQQDIIEGLQYVLSLGLGDPKRVGIFGHSFGGFSTLGALAFTPDLFQVGIAGAAPTDLVNVARYAINNPYALDAAFKNVEPDSVAHLLKQTVVDLSDPADVKRLSDKSPLRHADKVSKPLLMIAGRQDDRVPIHEINAYASKQQMAGKEISLLVDDNEGHGFSSKLAVQGYAYALEKILADKLGGRLEPINDELLRAYMKKNLRIDQNQLSPQ